LAGFMNSRCLKLWDSFCVSILSTNKALCLPEVLVLLPRALIFSVVRSMRLWRFLTMVISLISESSISWSLDFYSFDLTRLAFDSM